MTKDHEQLIKARIKTNAALKIINAIYEMNNVVDDEDVKVYSIKLKHLDFGEFYKFFIDIYKGDMEPKKIFSIKFSLANLKEGDYLFGKIVNDFVQNDFIYAGFTVEKYRKLYEDFFVQGYNNINLTIDIITKEEQDKLVQLKEKLDIKNNLKYSKKKQR